MENPTSPSSLPIWVSDLAVITSIIGFLVSIASFLITIYVAASVKEIRQKYVFRVRAPELVKKLAKGASNLSDLSGSSGASAVEISLEMGKIGVALNSLKKKASGDAKAAIENATFAINGYTQNVSEDGLWRVYTAVQLVIEEIKNVQEDSKWES